MYVYHSKETLQLTMREVYTEITVMTKVQFTYSTLLVKCLDSQYSNVETNLHATQIQLHIMFLNIYLHTLGERVEFGIAQSVEPLPGLTF